MLLQGVLIVHSSTTAFSKIPNLIKTFFNIIEHFRLYRVALTVDLEKAFLIVSVAEADCYVLWFIWVVKDSLTSVFRQVPLLNATIHFHLENYIKTNANIVHKLLCSTYVDDVIASAQTVDKARDLYVQSKKIFNNGGLNLRKFLMNSKSIQKQIGVREGDNLPSSFELTYSEIILTTPQPAKEKEYKVLGNIWNPELDQFVFDVNHIAKLALNLKPMKTNLVNLVGRFYDALGFLPPPP